MLTDALIRLQTLRNHTLAMRRGYQHWRSMSAWRDGAASVAAAEAENALWKYFSEHKEGLGIWKLNHYFEAYRRYFARFRGRDVHVLEIGIYSGGSLEMWRSYFGPQSHIYGVDIEPACKAYESDGVKVFIGDQSDRSFWRSVKEGLPDLDVVIDDGSHVPGHQIITLEELLPHLRPGGIYMCEDISTVFSEFASYVFGMAQNLNAGESAEQNVQDNERRQVIKTNALQAAVAAVHLYPFLTVIERAAEPVPELVGPKRGTQWAPFLK
jgi:23S rRNA U2552 (ribose-2'-O)-methylase RlmE/FtsJ